MQMDKIRRHLGSIYRKFIRKGDMKLYINDEILNYEEPEVLKAPFYNNLSGRRIEWKKEIDFSFGKYKPHLAQFEFLKFKFDFFKFV